MAGFLELVSLQENLVRFRVNEIKGKLFITFNVNAI
ncbi:hypothetical protein COLO4_37874 [Corchorus olitorius]|uniref:Uncharacterized protein n=1 Tax=Corchorus olitorius TaxID=93759 RepID=A0A1R3FYD6_9ROSI|nr:hypothetical protein COLO4_37874 [Corchorus olitorius]